MVPLFSHASAAAGASLSSVHNCSLKFAHPIPPLFSKRRNIFSIHSDERILQPLSVANAGDSTGSAAAKPAASTTIPYDGEDSDAASILGQNAPREGIIQFQKPKSFSSFIRKWSRLSVLIWGDVAALLLLSAIWRFSHGFSVFDPETMKVADPFIAGWFLSAYFLGGYAEEGRGMNGFCKAVATATKSWCLGIPLGIVFRAVTIGHTPPTNFILAAIESTGVVLIGWRAIFLRIFPCEYKSIKRESAFQLL